MPRNITRKESVKNLFSLLLSRRTDGFLNTQEQSIREEILSGLLTTGRAIALKGIAIYRVQGGKLMERWVVSDLHGLLEEIRG
jgi:hypothetical protein